jgi:hypothetical protein
MIWSVGIPALLVGCACGPASGTAGFEIGAGVAAAVSAVALLPGLARMGLTVDGGDLVLAGLFATTRLPLALIDGFWFPPTQFPGRAIALRVRTTSGTLAIVYGVSRLSSYLPLRG